MYSQNTFLWDPDADITFCGLLSLDVVLKSQPGAILCPSTFTKSSYTNKVQCGIHHKVNYHYIVSADVKKTIIRNMWRENSNGALQFMIDLLSHKLFTVSVMRGTHCKWLYSHQYVLISI